VAKGYWVRKTLRALGEWVKLFAKTMQYDRQDGEVVMKFTSIVFEFIMEQKLFLR
jgi:hypothetical protein